MICNCIILFDIFVSFLCCTCTLFFWRTVASFLIERNNICNSLYPYFNSRYLFLIHCNFIFISVNLCFKIHCTCIFLLMYLYFPINVLVPVCLTQWTCIFNLLYLYFPINTPVFSIHCTFIFNSLYLYFHYSVPVFLTQWACIFNSHCTCIFPTVYTCIWWAWLVFYPITVELLLRGNVFSFYLFPPFAFGGGGGVAAKEKVSQNPIHCGHLGDSCNCTSFPLS